MPKVVRLRKDSPATWEEAMESYLWFKQAGGLWESTLKGQWEVIRLFFNRHPEAWQGDLKQAAYRFFVENIKPATYNIRLAYLKSFFAWCVKEGILTENPLSEFKKRKAEGWVVEFDASILQELLALPDKGTFAGLRDYSLMLFVPRT